MKTLLRTVVKLAFKPLLGEHVPLALQRAGARGAVLLTRCPPGTTIDKARLGGVPALRYRNRAIAPGRALLLLHGGAYILGGNASHRGLAAHLALAAGAEVWMPDYRLAPEHPCPAAIEDALSQYGVRFAEMPLTPDRIVAALRKAGGFD